MPYPGYLLNPGDMFQVEPERVLFATGAVKEKLPKVERLIEKENRIARQHIARETRPAKLKKSTTSTITSVGSLSGINIEDVRKERRQDFQGFLLRLDDEIKKATSAKRKQDLRAVRKDVMTVTRNLNQRTAETLDDDLNRLLAKMTIAAPSKEEVAEAEAGERAVQAESKAQEPTPEYVKALREAMVKARENPVDNSKPYATPWEPRPYMSAFAFIPRYLEVNHSICSGVYLRHPVARPTLAEVPSPFPQEVQQLAFNWYLRRR
jgi:ribosomal protein S4